MGGEGSYLEEGYVRRIRFERGGSYWEEYVCRIRFERGGSYWEEGVVRRIRFEEEVAIGKRG